MTVDLDQFGYAARDLGIGLELLWAVFETDGETAEREWRAQFGGQDWLFTDTTAFCRLTAAIRVMGNWLCATDFPGQTLHAQSYASNGRSLYASWLEEFVEPMLWDPRELPGGAGDPDDVEATIEMIHEGFATFAVALPTPGFEPDRAIIHACTVGVTRAMRAMHDRFGPSPLDGEGAYDLMMLCLRAHLGQGPPEVDDAVWPGGTRRSDQLDAVTPLARAALDVGCVDLRFGVSVATSCGWSSEMEPLDVLERALRARRSDLGRVWEARRELNEFARRDGELRGYLRQVGEIMIETEASLPPDADLFREVALDAGPLFSAYAELEHAGRFKRRGARMGVASAAERLLASWDRSLGSLEDELARRKADAELARQERKSWFRVWDEGQLDFIALRDFATTSYSPGARDLYFAGEVATGVVSSETEAVPLFLPVRSPPALIFYAETTNHVADVLNDIHVLLAARLAYREPGSIAMSWLDPAHVADPGPFRDLLRAGPQLGLGIDGLAADNRTVNELLDHLDRAGDTEHVVVVPGFPAEFDPDTSARVLALAERGPASGVQLVAVTVSANGVDQLPPAQVARVPHVPIIRGPDLDGVPGYDFIPYRLDGRIERLRFSGPRVRREEVADIVSSYTSAST